MSLLDRIAKKVTGSSQPQTPDQFINYIEKNYYSDYPRMPYISADRDFNDWLERVSLFPQQMLVPVANMISFDDGLLPGQVYLLYWSEKQKKEKEYPGYFEYVYGIDPGYEIDQLHNLGFVNENHKLTDAGWDALRAHWEVILDRTPKAKISQISNSFVETKKPKENIVLGSEKTRYRMNDLISETVYKGKYVENYYVDSDDYPLLDDDLETICDLTNRVLQSLGITHFLNLRSSNLSMSSASAPFNYRAHLDEINYRNWLNAISQGLTDEQFNRLSPKDKEQFGGREDVEASYADNEVLLRDITHVMKMPLTKAGKKAKYPQVIALSNGRNYDKGTEEVFGTISYLKDGSIGSAEINWWGNETKANHISLGIVDSVLIVKSISVLKSGDSRPTTLYDYLEGIEKDEKIDSEKTPIKVKVKVKNK